MDIRHYMYSPVQNLAVWVAAWLAEVEPTDSLLGAFRDIGGNHEVVGGGELTDLLRMMRVYGAAHRSTSLEASVEAPSAWSELPVVSLLMAGPGQAPVTPAIPEGTAIARSLVQGDLGGLAVHGAGQSLYLVPAEKDGAMVWSVFETDGLPRGAAPLLPGDADHALAEATRDAAQKINAAGYRFPDGTRIDPRLTVGTLTDYYDVPGIPETTPVRSTQLFARADRVSAIIETLLDRVGDHSLDPYLLPLWAHIRNARIAGVDYAAREWAKRAGRNQ